MRTNIIPLLLLALSASVPSLSSMAQQTKVLTAEKHNEYGLVYSLPVTALQVKVEAVKETNVAGPYYQYAKKYIGTDKVVTEDSELWTISNVEMLPYGVADTEHRYLMQLKSGATTFMGVASDGMLLSINAKPDFSSQTLKAEAADLMASHPTCREYLQYVGEDFLASQSKAKQAEMLAASLMEVRDAYVSLTRGTADNMPTDGRQLELMLNSLKQQEEALTRAFTGVSYRERESRVFTFTPREDGRSVLFRLSDFAGFTTSDDYSGEPVYISVKIKRRGTLPTDANGEEKKFPKEGIAYSLPGTANVAVSFKGEELLSMDQEFAQFGTVFGLNPTLFTSKKDPSYATFSPITGGLMEIGSVKDLKESEESESSLDND